jgi:hypothetical protein
MKKALEIFTILGDFINIIVFIFSFQLHLNHIISIISAVAFLLFLLIFSLSYFCKRDEESIMKEIPPLNSIDIKMKTHFKNSFASDTVDVKIEEWNRKRQERIKESYDKYLLWQKVIFVIAFILTLSILIFI